jgi:hypothetical protein
MLVPIISIAIVVLVAAFVLSFMAKHALFKGQGGPEELVHDRKALRDWELSLDEVNEVVEAIGPRPTASVIDDVEDLEALKGQIADVEPLLGLPAPAEGSTIPESIPEEPVEAPESPEEPVEAPEEPQSLDAPAEAPQSALEGLDEAIKAEFKSHTLYNAVGMREEGGIIEFRTKVLATDPTDALRQISSVVGPEIGHLVILDGDEEVARTIPTKWLSPAPDLPSIDRYMVYGYRDATRNVLEFKRAVDIEVTDIKRVISAAIRDGWEHGDVMACHGHREVKIASWSKESH